MRIRDFFRRLVADAPQDVSACEFRCRKTECRHGEWEQCDFRIRDGLPIDLPEGGRASVTAVPGRGRGALPATRHIPPVR